ncbi:unnamed protein product, partial [Prorocentrum cordatum]
MSAAQARSHRRMWAGGAGASTPVLILEASAAAGGLRAPARARGAARGALCCGPVHGHAVVARASTTASDRIESELPRVASEPMACRAAPPPTGAPRDRHGGAAPRLGLCAPRGPPPAGERLAWRTP